ncbi:MAG TPA: LamG domain-containing protein [Dehalococcoidia bacterium]|jgi:hypothetical protein|nr:LamG domain-containing protein [Dehalococcoidia bacterium]
MKTVFDELVFGPPGLGGVLYLPGPSGGGSKICDRSPYGNVGTITGATWMRLSSGLWCVNFDGVDDCVSCGHEASLDITTEGTWLAWVKASQLLSSTAHHTIFSKAKRSATPEEANYWVAIVSTVDGVGYLEFYAKDAGGNWTSLVDDTTPLSTGDFYHLAVVFAGGQVSLYVNGRRVKRGTLSISSLLATTGDLEVGRGQGGGGVVAYHFAGGIALPSIYNYAWSELQVQNAFGREKYLFGVW